MQLIAISNFRFWRECATFHFFDFVAHVEIVRLNELGKKQCSKLEEKKGDMLVIRGSMPLTLSRDLKTSTSCVEPRVGFSPHLLGISLPLDGYLEVGLIAGRKSWGGRGGVDIMSRIGNNEVDLEEP